MTNPYLKPQIRALRHAIEALKKERQVKYAAGHAAFSQGIRTDALQGEVTGDMFAWVEADERKYQDASQDIRQLEDMIEILEDSETPITISKQLDLW